MARGKRSVTLDLRHPEGREVALRLVAASDVVLENFRPGTLERWGLGPDVLRSVRPDIVLTRISGSGQNGPYRERPGFANVAESLGGLRNLTGFPRPAAGADRGQPRRHPRRPVRRDRRADGAPAARAHPGRRRAGEVDVALYEAVFGVLEDLVPEHDGYGVVRQRSGAALPGIVPSNTYPTADGNWVAVGGNGDAIYRRLMTAVERPDLADDPRLGDNPGRVAHRELIDDAISAWTSAHDLDTVVKVLEVAGVPVGPILEAADMLRDPHFAARGMLVRHEVEVAPGDVRRSPSPAWCRSWSAPRAAPAGGPRPRCPHRRGADRARRAGARRPHPPAGGRGRLTGPAVRPRPGGSAPGRRHRRRAGRAPGPAAPPTR